MQVPPLPEWGEGGWENGKWKMGSAMGDKYLDDRLGVTEHGVGTEGILVGEEKGTENRVSILLSLRYCRSENLPYSYVLHSLFGIFVRRFALSVKFLTGVAGRTPFNHVNSTF